MHPLWLYGFSPLFLVSVYFAKLWGWGSPLYVLKTLRGSPTYILPRHTSHAIPSSHARRYAHASSLSVTCLHAYLLPKWASLKQACSFFIPVLPNGFLVDSWLSGQYSDFTLWIPSRVRAVHMFFLCCTSSLLASLKLGQLLSLNWLWYVNVYECMCVPLDSLAPLPIVLCCVELAPNPPHPPMALWDKWLEDVWTGWMNFANAWQYQSNDESIWTLKLMK